MKKEGSCNPGSTASWLLRNFLGLFLLLNGLQMLLNYSGTVSFMMGVGGSLPLGPVMPVADVVTMALAYSWPVVSVLVGLSFLFSYKKCWATKLVLLYLLLFSLGNMWSGNMGTATFDLLVALLVVTMKMSCGIAMACEKK